MAACGGGADDAQPAAAEEPSAQEAIGATLDILMGDLYFGETPDNIDKPPVWTVSTDQKVQLNFKNGGTLQHDWAIVKPGSEIPVPFIEADNSELILWRAGLIDPASEKSETVAAPAAGEYSVICTVAGHYPSMQGKLVVQ